MKIKILKLEIGKKAIPISEDVSIELQIGEVVKIDISSGGFWYGHGFNNRQPYPLNRESLSSDRFAVNNIQSPIWLASNGFALLAETNEALQVKFNVGSSGLFEILCPSSKITLKVYTGASLSEANSKLLAHLGWPNTPPEPTIFGDSIFCTWTQYPRSITQDRILGMARAIRENGYPCSTIIIDDRWESGFGELAFSKDFPDPVQMVKELHKLDLKIILWVTPFINEETANFKSLEENKLLVMRKDGNGASLFKWWGGTAGLIDLTHPEGRKWYKEKLLHLKNVVGIDGFKIDGGDAKYQPDPAVSLWHSAVGDSGYSDLMLELFEGIAPNLCESRTAWLSQRRNIVWREGGKDSHWGIDNGMKALVTLGLHLSLMGYDILIPDMIPGRVQTMVSSFPLPTDELFIRWTEASVFFPCLQFSYFPWNYAKETQHIVKQYALLHKALEGYLTAQATNRTAPLMRPLWYNEPEREELYAIDDEFMLGNDILIAPVLQENQNTRDIILPKGIWKDCWTGKVYEKDRLIQYPAPCPGIPLFVREDKNDLFVTLNNILKLIHFGSTKTGKTSTTWECGLNRDIKVTG